MPPLVLAGASEEVLDAVAGALQLDEAERSHLHDLARAVARRPARRPKRTRGPLPDSVLRVLDSMTDSPAFIRNGPSTSSPSTASAAPCTRRCTRRTHRARSTSPASSSWTRSEEFRTAWAKHNVRLHHTGRRAFRHPVVGEITLDFDAMELPAQPGLTLTAYSAGPHTPAHDALQLLAAWAATTDACATADPHRVSNR